MALSKNGLNVPFFFNRKEVKDHGEGGVFVGYVPQPGQEVVIVEDVITAAADPVAAYNRCVAEFCD